MDAAYNHDCPRITSVMALEREASRFPQEYVGRGSSLNKGLGRLLRT